MARAKRKAAKEPELTTEQQAMALLQKAIANGQFVGGDAEADLGLWLARAGFATIEDDARFGTWRLHPTSTGRAALRDGRPA